MQCGSTCNEQHPRGYSSAGRARVWHTRGQGSDSPYLHEVRIKMRKSRALLLIAQVRSYGLSTTPRDRPVRLVVPFAQEAPLPVGAPRGS
jgi:hypothetical protein